MKLIIKLIAVLLMPSVVFCAAPAAASYSSEDINKALELIGKNFLDREIIIRRFSQQGMGDEEIKEIQKLVQTIEEAVQKFNGPMGEFAVRKFLIGKIIIQKSDLDKIINKIIQMQNSEGPSQKTKKFDSGPKKDEPKIEISEVVEKWAKKFKDLDPETNRFQIIKKLKDNDVDQTLFQQIMVRINQLRAKEKLNEAQKAAPAQAQVQQQAAVKNIRAAGSGLTSIFDQIRALRKDDQANPAMQLQQAQESEARAKTESDRKKAEQAVKEAKIKEENIEKYLQSLEALSVVMTEQLILEEQWFKQSKSAVEKAAAQKQLEQTKQQHQEVSQEVALLESTLITKDFMSYVARKALTWVNKLPKNKNVAYADVENLGAVAKHFTKVETLYVQGFLQSQLL
jgi:hypothetical protein